MKRSEVGLLPERPGRIPADPALRIFAKAALCRAFELKTAEVFKQGLIRVPIYLSVGQEMVAAVVSEAFAGCRIFGQHRAHAHYICHGGDLRALADELLHLPTGCARGMGGSASIHSPRIGMYGHSGLMGDHVPIAVGAALASGRPTLAVFGDAAAEEDYVAAAMGFAATRRLPVLFLCEDNNLSILTTVDVRRSWSLVDVAKGMGLAAVDLADDPASLLAAAADLSGRLPAFLNVRTCRHLWHAGIGVDGPPEWNRYEMMKESLRSQGLSDAVSRAEADAQSRVEKVWGESLAARAALERAGGLAPR